MATWILFFCWVSEPSSWLYLLTEWCVGTTLLLQPIRKVVPAEAKSLVVFDNQKTNSSQIKLNVKCELEEDVFFHIPSSFTPSSPTQINQNAPRRSYFLDPLNWGDMLSALGLPVLAAVGFAQDMPDTRNEIRVHQFLYLDDKTAGGCFSPLGQIVQVDGMDRS